MQRVKDLLRRLSSPRNILPLIAILGAIVGVFNISLFGLTVKPEQIIISLLGFLAVDALIERLDILTNIEQGIQSVTKLINPKVPSEAFFHTRDFSKVEKIIRESHNEIWIYGVTLDGLVTLVNPMQDKLRKGCKIRILAPNPDGNEFEATARYFGSRPAQLASRLKGNLDNLGIRFRQVQNSDFEIKVLNRVFTTGYVISDPNSAEGKMLIQLYMFWFGVNNSPNFEIVSKDDKEWHPVFIRQFNKAWEFATTYVLPSKGENKQSG